MSKKIAVVGGGPKAAAICAKVNCLRRAGVRIEVFVFEKSQWGAAWSGVHGYTDGRQRLCTPAERDVGFPYQAGLLTAEQTADLHARYSWAAYLVSKADGLTQSMKDDLSLDLGVDGLHAPMVSQVQGPGFASLMVLGSMSDRILAPYLKE